MKFVIVLVVLVLLFGAILFGADISIIFANIAGIVGDMTTSFLSPVFSGIYNAISTIAASRYVFYLLMFFLTLAVIRLLFSIFGYWGNDEK